MSKEMKSVFFNVLCAAPSTMLIEECLALFYIVWVSVLGAKDTVVNKKSISHFHLLFSLIRDNMYGVNNYAEIRNLQVRQVL